MTTPARVLPEVTPEMAPFWEAARRHELVVQRCSGCGAHRFPARDICSRCLSRQATWERVSGRGTIFSFVVMHQAYHPAFQVPYAVVEVELEEGARMLTNVVGCPPDQVKIGMPVEVTFEAVNEDIAIPRFKPVAS